MFGILVGRRQPVGTSSATDVCGPLFRRFDVFCLKRSSDSNVDLWYWGFYCHARSFIPPPVIRISIWSSLPIKSHEAIPGRVMVLILQQVPICLLIASLWYDRYCRCLVGSNGHMFQWVVGLCGHNYLATLHIAYGWPLIDHTTQIVGRCKCQVQIGRVIVVIRGIFLSIYQTGKTGKEIRIQALKYISVVCFDTVSALTLCRSVLFESPQNLEVGPPLLTRYSQLHTWYAVVSAPEKICL